MLKISRALAIGAATAAIGGEFVPVYPIGDIIVDLDVRTSTVYKNFTNEKDLSVRINYGTKRTGLYHSYLTVVNLANGNVIKDNVTSKAATDKLGNCCYFNLTFPFKGNLTDSGLSFSLKIRSGDLIGFDQTFTLYPATVNSFDVTDNVRTYSHSGRYFYIANSELFLTETFDFSSTLKEVSNKAEGRINLEELFFNFYSEVKFSYSTITITFNDSNNVFKNLSKNMWNQVSIQLKATQTTNKVTFSLGEAMYVNPDTNQMTRSPSIYTQETTELCIPYGYESKLAEESIFINFNQAGSNKDFVSIPLKFVYRSAYIGSCYFSDICIIGGVKE